MTTTVAQLLARYTDRLLKTTARSIEDLSLDELHFRPHRDTNSVAFEAWHVARTADNLVNFAFERKQPVWLAQGLDQAWNLPKVDQGTGMTPETAYALRFPEAALLARYALDVAASVVPQIEAMTDDYLASTMTIRPQGEMARLDIIAQVVVIHGNNHLGQVNLGRTMQGKPGLGF